MRTYVDRGGTFTDLLTVDDHGRAQVRKVRSDQAIVGELAQGTLTFGTTVATNALLERAGVPTLLVVTRGFGDLVRIRDMTRPALFDPDQTWPEPLCARVVEVDGRLAADGTELEPLVLPEEWPLDGIEGVAIALLHSPRNPAHEQAVAAAIGGRCGAREVHLALGHALCPQPGYLARIETTLVDAAITPVLRRALGRDRIPPGARAVRSDGSWCPAEDLRAPDAVLSGPATGVLAVAAVARQADEPRVIGLDLGGTSADVCIVGPGALPFREDDGPVASVRVRRPMLEVETVAAGGGSVLWTDGVRLGVGPASAGADPGPQCYGRGGPPTLTDAVLATGGLDPARFDPPLDPRAVALPRSPGSAASEAELAEQYLAVARAELAQAIRRLAARRGLDPADHALVSFGGAAGQHAAFVAEELGIRRVLVHPAAAVLCAWGQALARREETLVRSLSVPIEDRAAVEAALDALERRLATGGGPAVSGSDLGSPGGEVRRTLGLRHVGTDHPLEVEAGERAVEAFTSAHRARYGFDRDLPIEVAWVRVRVSAPPDPLPVLDDDPFDLGDRVVEGPVRLDGPTTSVLVPVGWRAERRAGLLVLTHADAAPRPLPVARTPAAVAVWASRFQAVATSAGAALERTARSVNIRDRRDFSCAVFDPEGRLVANAPHVPVHLGAMGETVRDLIRSVPDLREGQHWLTNDPGAGGSHLPDLTVVSPVEWDGVRLLVACRAHHVDVGGSTPGSMPPRSASLAEEGFVVRHLALLDDGRIRADLAAHLVGCRQLDVVRADLEAQIASNVAAARWLRELGPGPVVAAWAGHLLDVAEESVHDVVEAGRWPAAAEDEIDGVPLRLALRREGDHLVVDLSGTGGPHPGNLNAPRAVVRAAVLYALRVLAGRPIPLNEGVLRRVRIRCPAGSIVDPPPGAAVAGGNVETSQRLVDLILRAAGHAAGSAGTMSNLTLGGEDFGAADGPGLHGGARSSSFGGPAAEASPARWSRWSLYETVGGGQGASPRGPGPSGRQLHMTNTRATDPEVLEDRLPVRVRAFRYRVGTGGGGIHRGGDGLVRELEVLAPATAALLATRRDRGAPGLGGEEGAPGLDRVRIGGVWSRWDGEPVALGPGDRVEVGTPGGGGWSEE